MEELTQELIQQLKNHNTELKIQNELTKRRSSRVETLALFLVFAVILITAVFGASMFLCTQEQTKVLQTMALDNQNKFIQSLMLNGVLHRKKWNTFIKKALKAPQF